MDQATKEKLAKAVLQGAEAKVAAAKIRRDAALRSLEAAQRRGAGPDERQRLIQVYDRAEERLDEAEEEARAKRRAAMGLQPRVEMAEEELVMLPEAVAVQLRRYGHGRGMR